MSAAKDIGLTDNEQNIVDCAWKATGVVQGACAPLTDPKVATLPPAPGTGAPGGTTNTTPGSGNTDETGSTDGTAAPAKRRGLAPQASSGCSVGAQGASDFGPFAGLVAAVLGLALSRRKRR